MPPSGPYSPGSSGPARPARQRRGRSRAPRLPQQVLCLRGVMKRTSAARSGLETLTAQQRLVRGWVRALCLPGSRRRLWSAAGRSRLVRVRPAGFPRRRRHSARRSPRETSLRTQGWPAPPRKSSARMAEATPVPSSSAVWTGCLAGTAARGSPCRPYGQALPRRSPRSPGPARASRGWRAGPGSSPTQTPPSASCREGLWRTRSVRGWAAGRAAGGPGRASPAHPGCSSAAAASGPAPA
mmetsp:Transcript_101837/g.314312  ORF Transcript_101837/g.314312 Transcript_101837/m.314312 type:complete len:240 (+) Transcript_101837:145-864(+)